MVLTLSMVALHTAPLPSALPRLHPTLHPDELAPECSVSVLPKAPPARGNQDVVNKMEPDGT
jgi:hypothetical protein